jgi:hypothetical protein
LGEDVQHGNTQGASCGVAATRRFSFFDDESRRRDGVGQRLLLPPNVGRMSATPPIRSYAVTRRLIPKMHRHVIGAVFVM